MAKIKKNVKVDAHTRDGQKVAAHTREIEVNAPDAAVPNLDKSTLGTTTLVELEPRFDSAEEAWASCLYKSSGVHLLDSGGSGGRGWQVMQRELEADGVELSPSAVADYLDKQEKATLSVSEKDDHFEMEFPTINVFHHLKDTTDFDQEGDARFGEWCEQDENQDLSWLAAAQAYADENWTDVDTRYTYNWETDLSRDLHWTQGTDAEGNTKALISIHTGADARGGFSQPIMVDLEDEFYFLDTQVEFYVSGPNGESGYMRSGDYLEMNGDEAPEGLEDNIGWGLKFNKEGMTPSGGELKDHPGWTVHASKDV